MNIHRGALLLTSMLLAGPALPSAKCPLETYQLHGVVQAGSGRPVAGAKVNIAWQAGQREHSVVTTSDSAGRYEVTVRFNPFAGEDQFGILCIAQLRVVTVAATAVDGQTAVKTVRLDQLGNEVRLVVSADAGASRPGMSMRKRARWSKW